ncbi:MAG TPA: ATP-binding protein, partial [Vicinamibacteria bacterium]
MQDVVARTGTSRQAVHRQLALLVRTGLLKSTGKARATRYHLASAPSHGEGPAAPVPLAPATFDRRYVREGLAEDYVWNEVVATFPGLANPEAKNAQAALAYALTEMVNNAIDHSGAATVDVRAGVGADTVWFEVRDDGVGAFENVRAALGLPDAL